MGGYLYKGDVQLKGNFEVISNKPLDSGTVVLNQSDLYTLKDNLYEGKTVTSVQDKSIYILIDKNNANNSSGWSKVGTSTDVSLGEIDLGDAATESLDEIDLGDANSI